MFRLLLLLTIPIFFQQAYAQEVKVPSRMEFGGMDLFFTKEARKKIQTDVNALRRSEKYFNAKVRKVAIHFPIIETILKQEQVPMDFRFLVIQESALVGDAVSSSNAVGYWQFKKPSAREVGLKINNVVDERKHLIKSTHGAARYLKSNNEYFDNWVYALMAYNTGPGGALDITNRSKYGVNRMKIDGDMHWYVLKFFAHKIAFEDALEKIDQLELRLEPYYQVGGKTLSQIASEFNLTKDKLEPYNKWLRTRRIPEDSPCPAIIPIENFSSTPLALQENHTSKPEKGSRKVYPSRTYYEPSGINVPDYKDRDTDTDRFPVIDAKVKIKGTHYVEVNGLQGIVAQTGDDVNKLARKGDIAGEDFIEYNNLDNRDASIIPGKVYYLEDKRKKARAYYHTVKPGENLWSVSQRFGMELKKLMRRNRLRTYKEVEPGRILWLRFIRPRRIPVEFNEIKQEKPQERIAEKINEANIKKDLKDELDLDINLEKNNFLAKVDTTIDSKPLRERKKERKGTELNSSTKDEKKPVIAPKAKSESPKNSQADPDYGKEENTHLVKQGQTYFGISRLYDMSLDSLLKLNNKSLDDTLQVGEKLYVRGEKQHGESEKSENKIISKNQQNFVYYEVKSGDTMYKIGRKYDVTIKNIMDWNNKTSFDVEVGEKIKIKQGAR